MNLNFALKIASLLFFNLPLIVSMILLLLAAISFFRGHEIELQKLYAGIVGIISVIISSVTLMFLPTSVFPIIDKVGFWIVKFLYVLLILFTIGDTYEGNTNGIKALGGFSIAIVLFSLIMKAAH